MGSHWLKDVFLDWGRSRQGVIWTLNTWQRSWLFRIPDSSSSGSGQEDSEILQQLLEVFTSFLFVSFDHSSWQSTFSSRDCEIVGFIGWRFALENYFCICSWWLRGSWEKKPELLSSVVSNWGCFDLLLTCQSHDLAKILIGNTWMLPTVVVSHSVVSGLIF